MQSGSAPRVSSPTKRSILCAYACPAAAASANSDAATASSCATPRPLAYIQPRLYCASASPARAAAQYSAAALSGSLRHALAVLVGERARDQGRRRIIRRDVENGVRPARVGGERETGDGEPPCGVGRTAVRPAGSQSSPWASRSSDVRRRPGSLAEPRTTATPRAIRIGCRASPRSPAVGAPCRCRPASDGHRRCGNRRGPGQEWRVPDGARPISSRRTAKAR